MIYGSKTITYKLVFVNIFRKLLSLSGVQTEYSLYMTSSESNAKIIRKHVIANRHQYTIHLNDEEVGTLEMKQFLKSGGKQQLPYIFNYKSKMFDVSSAFPNNETKITFEDDVSSAAKHGFLGISKSKRTKKRGEKHTIHVHSARVEKEILIAIYL